MTGYVFLEKEKAEKVLKEGLAPERDGIRGIGFPSVKGPYIAAFFHPAENYAPAEDGTVCLRAEIPVREAFVADAARVPDKIAGTLLPLAEYKLGTYRRPFIVIPGGLAADCFSKRDNDLDAPLLYENSEKLYIDRSFALAEESDPGFRERALKAYYESLVDSGRAVKRSGEARDVKEDLLTGEPAKKKERGGLFRFFSKGNGPETVRIIEEIDEYSAPDGTVIGISIGKEQVPMDGIDRKR
jgi:hypothetical protein